MSDLAKCPEARCSAVADLVYCLDQFVIDSALRQCSRNDCMKAGAACATAVSEYPPSWTIAVGKRSLPRM